MKIRKKSNLRATAFATLILTVGFMLVVPHSLFAKCPDVAYWKLDEDTIGTYVDIIGGFDGDRASRAPEPAVDFKVGGAQAFDGQSTGIDIPADAEGDGPFDWAGDAGFTIEFWLNRAAGISENEVVIGRQRGDHHWWAGLWDSGKVAFILIDSDGKNGGNLTGSDNLADGEWHHVAIVRDGANNQHRLYVDGEQDAGATVDVTPGTYTGNFASTSDALNIGWLNYPPSGCCYFNGALDEVALFNKALAESDIKQDFDAGDLRRQGYCQLDSAPSAVADSGTVDEAGTLSVNAANGVLANDSDPESQPLTAILVSGVSNGSLTLNADGSYTYTHDGSETTSDSFTYKANDGTSDSNTVAVTITVKPQNDVPQISNGGASIPTTANTGEQYTYDFDVTDPDGPSATWSLANNPTGMVIDTNGVVTWTPADGTTSSGDVTVIVSDGTGQDSETFTITVGGGSSKSGGGGGSGCFINSLN
jgi:VCBS repeat-containing protein